MAKNKISQETIEKIQNLSYTELGKAVVSGDYSVKQLRQAYSQMRSVARKRIQRLQSPSSVEKFGKPNDENFRTTRNLVTTSELLKEIRDVSRFLKTKESTITGMKERRDWQINRLQKLGFNVENKDYPKIKEFLEWFKDSEFSMKYDSDSPTVVNVYNSEEPTKEDWERAFNAFKEVVAKPAPVRKY